ncbi:MAG: cyclic nucleotide-binding domain-containing protein [Myxococcales bacterium]|nr:cyclic nucleotide-binding domain-containing protein [Myxococcales bacterium]
MITPEALARIGLFKDLADDTLAHIISNLTPHAIEPGTQVLSEGTEDVAMFVVLGGELEVLKRISSSKRAIRVALLGPGDWFGEMSLLDPKPRSASVRALAPSTLLSMNKEEIQALIYDRSLRDYATFMTNIARALAHRLRVTSGILSQAASNVHNI